MQKLNAQQLRDIPTSEAEKHAMNLKRNPIYLILENVYDTYNIGGLFRLADALAVEKIYLCGEMETPPNSRIKKASIGTYKIVPWEYKSSALEAIRELRELRITNDELRIKNQDKIPLKKGVSLEKGDQDDKENPITILAIEQSEKSVPYTQVDYTFPVALLVGNETYGVLPETLEAVDQVVEIPMWGINKSLNVIVSAAIVAYEVIRNYK